MTESVCRCRGEQHDPTQDKRPVHRVGDYEWMGFCPKCGASMFERAKQDKEQADERRN